MSDVTFGQFFLIIFLVLLNAFFVASEFAFVKVRPTQLESLIASGSRRAQRVKFIIEDLDRALSSTQLGITIASIGLGIVGETFFHGVIIFILEGFNTLTNLEIKTESRIIDNSAFLFGYFILTFMHVVIGELAPKSISIQFAEKTSMILAEPLYWFMFITDPFLRFFVRSSNLLLKLFNITPVKKGHHQVYTEDELKVIIKDSIDKGELEQYESKLIFNILNFTDKTVKSIHTPRTKVKSLPMDSGPLEILTLAKETGFSRIPIYAANLDEIQGFVHIKDLIGYSIDNHEEEFEIQSILRPVIVIPERKPLDDLLKEMQRLKTQVAVIVNEYGSVEGIVTIEDILEYIVGPIDDEFDGDSTSEILVVGNSVTSDGLSNIETLNQTLDQLFKLEITSESASTLAGYLLELSKGELLPADSIINDEQFQFTITETRGNRIERVSIIKLQ